MADAKIESKTNIDTLRTALNNKEFLNYLAKAPDQTLVDPTKPETVKKQWELFQLDKAVYSNLKEIYSTKQNKSKGLVKRSLSFLEKLNVNNFEWTPLEPVEKFTGNSRWESLLLGTARLERYLGQGAIRAYDVMRLAARSVATAGKDILSHDREIGVRSRHQAEKAGVSETSNVATVPKQEFEWTKITETAEETKGSKTKTESIMLIANRLKKKLEHAAIRTYDAARFVVTKTGSVASSVGQVTKKSLHKIPSLNLSRAPKQMIENERLLKTRFDLDPNSAAESLKIVREKLAKITEAKKGRKEMEDQLNTLREDIFDQNFMPATLAAEAIRNKINSNFKELIGEIKKDPDTVEKIVEVIDNVDKVISAHLDGTFDYVEGIDLTKIDTWANNKLEARARYVLGEAIEKIAIETEDDPLAKLEESVSPFITGSQTTRNFFVKGLRDLINEKKLDNDKLTLLKMLLTKLELEVIEKEITAPKTWAEKTRAHIDKAFS
ncbi:MAG: hypothetical protein HY226_00535 [Candidatus Vogelbacteria bacterium]|nr:hypothetical protein [Candidatus Vogelbacteria bacterium]